MSGTWSHASINKDMAAIISKYVWDIPATSSRTVTTYFLYRASTKSSWAFWNIKTVKTLYIEINGHIVLWLTTMQGQQSLTLHWRSISRLGREHFIFSFSYKCGQYFVYDCLHTVALQITQDIQQTIVDAPLMLIVEMGQGAYCFLLFL